MTTESGSARPTLQRVRRLVLQPELGAERLDPQRRLGAREVNLEGLRFERLLRERPELGGLRVGHRLVGIGARYRIRSVHDSPCATPCHNAARRTRPACQLIYVVSKPSNRS